nr:hypothetical protein [uncultured Capnocytophaga sp.]
MRLLYLSLLLLPLLLQAQTLKEKLSLAHKDFYKDNYQQVKVFKPFHHRLLPPYVLI